MLQFLLHLIEVVEHDRWQMYFIGLFQRQR